MRLSLSLSLVSAIRALLAVAVFTGVASAHAQMNDMSDMDDARYYLLGSVGYAEFNYNQSDISDFDGLSPDSSDVTVRGGLGIKFSDVSAFEIALSDLGFSGADRRYCRRSDKQSRHRVGRSVRV
jgi:opacity protein-like surface antigen